MNAHLLPEIRSKSPVIHCITNHVTSNDCANLLLACGAVPVMADAPEEASQITSQCSALVLNLGTPRSETLPAMLAAGWEAGSLGHPIVFDPVGVGASEFRTNMANTILHELPVTVIRGNRREVHRLAELLGLAATDEEERKADLLARETGAIVLMSGPIDYITDGKQAHRVQNGHTILRSITGAGCMLSALTGAFLSVLPTVSKETPGATPAMIREAAFTAAGMMGLAGELAAARMRPEDGNASCRTYLIDAIYHMDEKTLAEKTRTESLRCPKA